MKFIIYIRDAAEFANGNYFLGVNLCPWEERDFFVYRDGCTVIGEVDVDVEKYREGAIPKAVEQLDAQIREVRAIAESKIYNIESRKAKLLAITHQETE